MSPTVRQANQIGYELAQRFLKGKHAFIVCTHVDKEHIHSHIVRPDIYAAYRKSGYSKKYLAEHEGDIILHKAAKKAFDDLRLKKLPTVKNLQAEYAELLTQKKGTYAEYRTARDKMKELLIHKANVEQILGKEPENGEKKNEHERG